IYFDYDKYNIRDDVKAILEKNAAWLKKNPGVKIQVEGHCDERGSNEYNLALGDRRARSARDYLVLLGVDPKRVSTISFGEEKPLDPGHNEEAWTKNRRGHFVILK
ncbi:MAG: peptidoglycan-associated lipoprotein Pal, partial [Nitrospirota bacterium]